MNHVSQKIKNDVVAVMWVFAALLLGLSLISYHPTDPSVNSLGHSLKAQNWCGVIGSFLADGIYQLFGLSGWFLPAVFLRMGIAAYQGSILPWKSRQVFWFTMSILSSSALLAYYFSSEKIFQQQILVGGLLGWALSKAFIGFLNPIGFQVFMAGLFLISMMFVFQRKLSEMLAILPYIAGTFVALFKGLFRDKSKLTKKPKLKWEEETSVETPKVFQLNKVKELLENKAAPVPMSEQDHSAVADQSPIEPASSQKKATSKIKGIRRVAQWVMPKLDLLEDPPHVRTKVDEKEIRRKADLLTNKLAQFSVTGEVTAAKPGPAVTMFEFKPSADVKLSKITELADDLALALSSESLRIIAPIPGRDVVGIETSNSQRETVFLKDLLEDESFWKDEFKLPIALGKQANGESRIVDLRKMPHLLVAGTTGSGKSVFTVSAITGLLFKHSPQTLRLILIDPKQVDLAVFNQVPHLIMPPIREPKKAVLALKWAIKEMDKRYRSMSKFGARGLESFNETVSKLSVEEVKKHEEANSLTSENPDKKHPEYYYTAQPYIVIIVEEFGDLMAVDKINVEQSVVRLAQLARACGIHLVLAMQSPRKEVVTGLIKTNIPGRISFKVASKMDSRIILDDGGAERLLAQGDMLFLSPGVSKPQRHHGPFAKDQEIQRVAQFWSDQGAPEFDENILRILDNPVEFSESQDMGFGGDSEEEYDSRYDEILSWASDQKEVSASLIQRKFRLGYPRAARIIEIFEKEGVVGPAQGSKPRQVLVQSYKNLE